MASDKSPSILIPSYVACAVHHLHVAPLALAPVRGPPGPALVATVGDGRRQAVDAGGLHEDSWAMASH